MDANLLEEAKQHAEAAKGYLVQALQELDGKPFAALYSALLAMNESDNPKQLLMMIENPAIHVICWLAVDRMLQHYIEKVSGEIGGDA